MDYRVVTLEPAACLREGWAVVRDRYWLLLGITVVGLVVGSLAPLGILMGPMVCGIYVCLFKRMDRGEIGFADLLGGMHYFLQSFVATLIQLVPIMAMTIPVNLLLALQFVKRVYIWVGGPYREMAEMMGRRQMTVIVVVATVVVFLLSVFFGTFFMFSYPLIVERALAWRIEFVEAGEIDALNILQATMTGMRRAVAALAPAAHHALIDGNRVPDGMPCLATAIVDGDASEPAIMAASILAKVARDARMRELHGQYPQYGFDRHKGYPSAMHREALLKHGPCPQHRRSFAPVQRALAACAQHDLRHLASGT